MKRKAFVVVLAALFALSAPAFAAAKYKGDYKRSDTIWVPARGHLHSWKPVARDELILWASPSRPYLVKIRRPFTSLRSAHSVGVTSSAGYVTRYDRVIVDGRYLPIHSIVALDRKYAKKMRYKKHKKRNKRNKRNKGYKRSKYY